MVVVSEGVSITGPRLQVPRKKNKLLSLSCSKQVSIMLNNSISGF